MYYSPSLFKVVKRNGDKRTVFTNVVRSIINLFQTEITKVRWLVYLCKLFKVSNWKSATLKDYKKEPELSTFAGRFSKGS